jgi:hypothetical protein
VPKYVLEDFRRGVDTRRAAFVSAAGALSRGVNVHVTSGGDIEVRKAFVEIATLPATTFGLGAFHGSLYTFGSVAPPALPSGFTYQQLSDPTSLAMTSVVDIEPFDGEPFVIAKFGDITRSFYAGARVKDLDTDVCRFRFSVTDGTSSAGVNKVTSITVNGVEVLDTDVDWATSHEATAAAIAAQVNSFVSTPNYTAYNPAGTAEVVITSPHGTISTGHAVVVTVAGNVTVAPSSGVMEAPIDPPTSARTAGEKMYVTSGAHLMFSAVLDATNFSPNSDGGGFTNISAHSAGAEDLVTTDLFYEDLIVCAKTSAQRWHVEADDSNNERLQTFKGVGILAPRASTSYLDGPTFLLGKQGVRVFQTRDSSGRSLARGDSKAVDKELVAYIRSLAASVQSRAILLVEPEDDRIWAVIGSRIYVRSWFSGWEAPAWTEYDPGFTIDDYAILDNRLYVRSGTKVYLYGGTTGEEYDASEAIVRLPYANLRAPTAYKGLHGLDLGVEGEWSAHVSTDPDDTDFSDAELVTIATRQTFDEPSIPVGGQAAHISIELRHAKAEYARVSSVVFHYKHDTSD